MRQILYIYRQPFFWVVWMVDGHGYYSIGSSLGVAGLIYAFTGCIHYTAGTFQGLTDKWICTVCRPIDWMTHGLLHSAWAVWKIPFTARLWVNNGKRWSAESGVCVSGPLCSRHTAERAKRADVLESTAALAQWASATAMNSGTLGCLKDRRQACKEGHY